MRTAGNQPTRSADQETIKIPRINNKVSGQVYGIDGEIGLLGFLLRPVNR